MDQLLDAATEDLRLALFALGALFLLVLVIWEVVQRRRQRARARDEAPDPLLEPVRREPVRGEPVRAESDEFELPSISVRDRLTEPTIVDLDTLDLRDSSQSLPMFDSGVVSAVETVDPEDEPSPVVVAEPATVAPPSDALRLDWPAEEQRRIVALRVVARADERFTGASLRQALQGEGFRHGELDIFHRPVSDGRVLISAASLTRPGSFDLGNMDSMLFLGLNVFAVLPGPLPGRDTIDKLLLVGHTLAQRLCGELRDARGEALTEARLAELRREAAAADANDQPGSN